MRAQIVTKLSHTQTWLFFSFYFVFHSIARDRRLFLPIARSPTWYDALSFRPHECASLLFAAVALRLLCIVPSITLHLLAVSSTMMNTQWERLGLQTKFTSSERKNNPKKITPHSRAKRIRTRAFVHKSEMHANLNRLQTTQLSYSKPQLNGQSHLHCGSEFLNVFLNWYRMESKNTETMQMRNQMTHRFIQQSHSSNWTEFIKCGKHTRLTSFPLKHTHYLSLSLWICIFLYVTLSVCFSPFFCILLFLS